MKWFLFSVYLVLGCSGAGFTAEEALKNDAGQSGNASLAGSGGYASGGVAQSSAGLLSTSTEGGASAGAGTTGGSSNTAGTGGQGMGTGGTTTAQAGAMNNAGASSAGMGGAQCTGPNLCKAFGNCQCQLSGYCEAMTTCWKESGCSIGCIPCDQLPSTNRCPYLGGA